MKTTDNQKDRLKNIRVYFKLNQKDFADSLGMKQGSYSDIERGRVGLSITLLQKIVKIYNVSADWILTGEADMFRENTDKKTTNKVVKERETNIENLYQQIKDLRQHLADKERIIQFMKLQLK
ncbi:MAG: helix-turn-helix domain-containing protein [Flavobacteriales bacterium]